MMSLLSQMPMPNYIPKLFDVLSRFHCHEIVLVGDIEKALLVTEDDRETLILVVAKPI